MKVIDKIKENYSSEIILLSVACFLAGVVAGMHFAPVKNITIGCNNKASNYKNCKCSSDDEDDNIN